MEKWYLVHILVYRGCRWRCTGILSVTQPYTFRPLIQAAPSFPNIQMEEYDTTNISPRSLPNFSAAVALSHCHLLDIVKM